MKVKSVDTFILLHSGSTRLGLLPACSAQHAVPCCDVLCLQVPVEVSAVVSQLQRVQPRMMADTVAMAEALEGLTVTRWEAWAGLLVELSLETNRKLLSLRVRVCPVDVAWTVGACGHRDCAGVTGWGRRRSC